MKFLRVSTLLLAATVLFAFQTPEPFHASDLVDSPAFAAKMKGKNPLILQVGFQALYKGARIPGAQYAGPGNSAEGLANLEKSVAGVAKDREVLLYCGCCPWEKCPNIRPAYKKLQELGFTKITVLKVPTNLHTDWVEKGLPVDKT
jgi:thiosulfate/3-mercaptopyruvate sulfurtransferase